MWDALIHVPSIYNLRFFAREERIAGEEAIKATPFSVGDSCLPHTLPKFLWLFLAQNNSTDIFIVFTKRRRFWAQIRRSRANFSSPVTVALLTGISNPPWK